MMRRTRQSPTPTTIGRGAVATCALLVAATLTAIQPASAVAPSVDPVDLGSAVSYSVLGASVANTGESVLAGDLGVSLGAITGFPPGKTMGTIHDKDAAVEVAESDRQVAYDAAAGQPSTGPLIGDQAGKGFKPGVYRSGAAITNSGTMTLDADGDASAVFVFQVGGAFSTAAAPSKIVLTDGALANNVFWQVDGAVSFGAGAEVVGTFLAAAAISFGEGASVEGRALTPAAVTLANTPFTQPKDDFTPPAITVDGGQHFSTNDTTPAISGTTDEPAGRPVTVTVAEQELTTTVGASGHWSVGAVTLPEIAHAVTASITDASQNTGTATQVLTVDTTEPVVTIAGGAHRATKDRTPTISGTTSEPVDVQVSVAVAGQTLTTTARAGGVWTVTAAALAESHHSVVVSVEDDAGNTGTASQIVSVDVTRPVVRIGGGSSRSTTDTSPWTYGTTGEPAGTTVRVAVGGQNLTTTVTAGGTWSVSARSLRRGTYRVVASIADAARNTGAGAQTLTVGEPPTVPRYRPDGAIRRPKGAFVGVGQYGGSSAQRRTATLSRARSAAFVVRLTNRGHALDRLAVRGTSKSKKFTVTYVVGGRNVTRAVVAGTFRTGTLRSGASVRMVVKVTRTRAARADDRRVFTVRAISSHASTRRDTVAAVVRR